LESTLQVGGKQGTQKYEMEFKLQIAIQH